MLPIARPLYTAPLAELSTFNTALAPLAQAEMVPSSVEKRKCDGVLPLAKKPAVLFQTVPVGAAGGVPPAGGGTVTTRACGVPLLL